MSEPVTGAYGLRFTGLGSDRWLAVGGAEHWPEVVTARAERGAWPGGEMSIDPESLEVRIGTDVEHSQLVHPLLGRVGAQVAIARGGDAMHAGAILGRGGAWGVIGPKEAGKSTLLATLAAEGMEIVTDDVLVFANGKAMAGPRCIDLREDAPRFGPTEAVRTGDPRARVSLSPIGAEHDLAGLLHLEWSTDGPTLEPLDHRRALTRLIDLRAEKGYPRDPRALLDLAALPAFVVGRRRRWDSLRETGALIGERLGGASSD